MDSSFYLVCGAIVLVIALLFAAATWSFFRRFKRLSTALNRAHEMTAKVEGSISEVVEVRRRNRSFRWRNEYPVITYTVGGQTLTTRLDWAEKRRGYYTVGERQTVCYVPSEPSCCVVESFRSSMQRSRTQSLIWTIVLALLTFNCVFGAFTQTLSGLM